MNSRAEILRKNWVPYIGIFLNQWKNHGRNYYAKMKAWETETPRRIWSQKKKKNNK